MSNNYDHVTPIADFDWDSLESKPSFRTQNGDKILSNAPYAQELYNQMAEYWNTKDLLEPKPHTIIAGHVVRKTAEYAEIDISWRESAYLELSKEDPLFTKYIQEGAEIEVYIKSTSNASRANTYNIIASYTELVKRKKFAEIKDAIGKNVAFLAKVKSLVYGGYFLDIDGIEVFMPGSQGGMNKLVDFEALVGRELYVCPINYDSGKNYMVVSHRAYLKTQVPTYAEQLEQGQEKEGFVTGTTKFGVFVEFDECLTGLIHKTDLSKEDQDKYTNEGIKPGDKIAFKIKEVVDPFRIVCTQKEIIERVDPWEDIEKKYKVPSQVQGTIKKIARFGAFVELEPRLTGLLHKSEFEDLEIDLKAGDKITVDLYRIDKESKKLYFKL